MSNMTKQATVPPGPVLPDPAVRPLVGLDIACPALDVSKNTAYSLIREKKFPIPVRRVGGTWKVSTAALAAYVRAGDQPEND